MTANADLLRQFAAYRDERAFAELVRRHVDPVYSAALRRVGNDSHLAEDITQQVFTALACRAATLVNHPHLTGWLYLAVRNEAANAVRTERRRKNREREAFIMQDFTSDSALAANWSRLAPVIDEVIDQLNDRDRTVVLLRFVENRPFSEIGSTLNVTEDAARMRVDRALEKLRGLLACRGVPSTAAALAVAMTQNAVASAPTGLAASTAALATAAAASTSAAALAILKLMTTANFISGVASVALVLIALTTATLQVHRSHTTNTALSAARESNAALSSRLNAINAQAGGAEQDAKHLSVQPTAPESSAVGDSTPGIVANVGNKTWNPVAEGTAFMERHPSVRQALHDWLNAQTNYRYSAFYVAEELTGEEIAEFQRLRRNGSIGRSLGPGQPEYVFAADNIIPWDEVEKQLSALLGPERYDRYQQFSASQPAREVSAQVATALAFSPTPLTSAQFDQLSQSIADHRLVEMTRNSGPKIDWSGIATHAREILAPEQRGVIDRLRAQGDYDWAYSNAVNAALLAAGAITAAPSSP